MSDDVLPLLQKLVAFETVAGNAQAKRACLQWVTETFFSAWPHELLQGEVEDCPYLYYKHPQPSWLWFAHLDVVPAEPHQFTLETEGDTLKGRGVKDMKGAALPFLMALRDRLAETEAPAVSVLLTTDEETAGPTIPTLLTEGELATPVAFTPDTGSNDTIVVEHKGVVWADLVVEGKGCHTAAPWSGTNPLRTLVDALQTLQQMFPEGTEDNWQLTVTPTTVAGSQARNQVPDTCSCAVDIRYPPQLAQSAEEALALVQAVLPTGCTLQEVNSAVPLQTAADHPLVQAVQRMAEDVTGNTVHIGREHGATDARYFGAAGIPAFLYGPKGGGLHGKDEWVSHSSLREHYEISCRLLSDYQ